MPQPPAPIALSEADYDLIEAAVMETARGRWFLAEHAKRNRHSDTIMLLGAIDRLETALNTQRTSQSVDRIRFDLFEMAKAIARTKTEIAAIKPSVEHQGKFGEATEELDSILLMTEAATSDILAAAEQVQDIAWTLNEQGLDPEVCDRINASATDIYTACSFQDLTGQRTDKVIQVLQYLEARINAMIDIWGLEGIGPAGAAPPQDPAIPAGSGLALDQVDVDAVLQSGPAGNPTEKLAPERPADRRGRELARTPVAELAPTFSAKTERGDALPMADAIRAIVTLSPEEKIALFT